MNISKVNFTGVRRNRNDDRNDLQSVFCVVFVRTLKFTPWEFMSVLFSESALPGAVETAL